MKKLIPILVLVFILGLPGIAFASDQQKVIISFDGAIQLEELQDIDYEVIHEYPSIHAVAVEIAQEEIDDVEALNSVQYVEKERSLKVSVEQSNWGYSEVDADVSKSLGLTGEGVKVAVIDTGVDKDHPDLNIAGGKNFVEGSSDYDDQNGHGTHVAGIINAQPNDIGTIGVAPDAKLYAVKALDQGGKGNQIDVIAAIQWAIAKDMDIINLSFTSPYASEVTVNSKTLADIIKEAHSQGIFVVAASGNDKSGEGQKTDDVMYPGRYDFVYSVGSVDQDLERSYFSYGGKSIDFVAPGERIRSTYVGDEGESTYGYLSGTSMSSPFVAGSIALYKELYPNYSFKQIEELLFDNAKDLGSKGNDSSYGHGFLLAPASYFSDVDRKRWYIDYVNRLAKDGSLEGYQDKTFRPTNDITRQEVVTVVGRTLGLDGTKRKTKFEDVPSDLYSSGYVASATDKGIIQGYPSDRFKPKQSITRGEVAVIIENAFGPFDSNKKATFSDVDADAYYADEVSALAEEEIITGYADGLYKPDQPIKRSELAAVLSKVLYENLR
ncbi:S8 family peptidase [Halobacillus salinus]|uniref:S8 family peptidase n=1 Tax=Halobacillus salinus TaxID=192814 RepID=UPI0013053EB6|nr:S8 family serine peptidase [Halobacillus salinus]